MTTIREQLEESQKVCNAATEGPWEDDYGGDIGQHWSLNKPWKSIVSTEVTCGSYCQGGSSSGVVENDDATFIVHARTALPLRNAQLAAVLKVHEPIDALNVNARNHHKVQVCTGCGQDDGNWNRWPCPTVRAIEDAAP